VVLLVWLTLSAGCQEGPCEQLCVYASADTADLVAATLEDLPFDVELHESADPVADARDGRRGRMHVAVVADFGCVDCYEMDGEDIVYEVHGDAPLGIQYGLTHLLELWGFRFFHPFQTVVPTELLPLDGHPELGSVFEPEMARRGLHLHTLHPIEGLWAVWVADDDAAERGRRIVDWTIRNRGNHLQWVALDDISTYPSVHEDWQVLTADLNDHAHQRGLTTGIGIQLFGSANLQLAFDLIDDIGTADEQQAQIAERLSLITDAGFDLYNLSFGEFFGEEPEVFLAAVDMAWDELQQQQPGAEMATVIHVGDSEDQQVEYLGESMQYYFLTQFADPAIVPWVHSVMYYNLFEDAGGAYHHEEFVDHRQFLLDRLAADEPVGYFPESAYWVAFDNPVPTYLPLYARSRWLDMDRIRAEDVGALQTHVLFSTGWEWGYWQNDYATLRMNYRLEDDWLTHVQQMYRPWGCEGEELAALVGELAELQHQILLEGRLAGYLAGRDAIMDVGYGLGIVSQPQRFTVEEVSGMDASARAAFEADVVEGLDALAVATWALDDRAQALAGNGDRWFVEVADGVRIDALRAEFAHAIYRAVLAWAETGDDGGWLAIADDLHTEARTVVAARHADMHDPAPDRLVDEGSNPTFYQYGYLIRAHELCFWARERAEAAIVIEGSDETPPGCAI